MRPPPRSVSNSSISRTSNAPSSRDVRDREPGERHPPARARALARAAGHVPAATEQQERQQPAAGLEPRRDRVAPPVGERALPGQDQRDQRDRAERQHAVPTIERTTSGVKMPGDVAAGSARLASSGRAARRLAGVEDSSGVPWPRLDLDHDREDHRPALGLLVQVARDAVLDLALEQADLADVVAGRVDRRSITRSTASSMIGSCSFRWTKPRVTISGRPTTEPVCLSTVTTIMNMPSFASERRSRRTTSPTSPTDRPSTNT